MARREKQVPTPAELPLRGSGSLSDSFCTRGTARISSFRLTSGTVRSCGAPAAVESNLRAAAAHLRVAIEDDLDANISAPKAGVVAEVGHDKGYGNFVVVDHGGGMRTLYAHAEKINVKVGEKVKMGDTLATVGNTGHSTGSHLHFEVRYFHNPIDPEHIIDFENGVLRDDNLIIHKNLFDYRKIDGTKRKFAQAKNKTPEQIAEEVRRSKEQKWHTIKRGDSLYAMALRYNTSVKKICSLNGISSGKILNIGDKLRIR